MFSARLLTRETELWYIASLGQLLIDGGTDFHTGHPDLISYDHTIGNCESLLWHNSD